jgi:hypothetical protein
LEPQFPLLCHPIGKSGIMTSEANAKAWHITGRWQEYEGESRANFLRVIALAAFYVVELVNYYGIRLGSLELKPVTGVDERFHLAATALTVLWVSVGLGIMFSLRNRYLPPWLKFASTAADLVILTFLLLLADGPRSPLTIGYLLVIGLSGLRFALPLVWFATGGSLISYLVILANARWYRPALRVPYYHEAIMALAVLLMGILLGQIVRQVRAIANDFAQRTGKRSESEGSA